MLIVGNIAEGANKPYMDNNGVVWVKSGSDKRRITSKEELRRLFQGFDLIHADEVPVNGTIENDIDNIKTENQANCHGRPLFSDFRDLAVICTKRRTRYISMKQVPEML